MVTSLPRRLRKQVQTYPVGKQLNTNANREPKATMGRTMALLYSQPSGGFWEGALSPLAVPLLHLSGYN